MKNGTESKEERWEAKQRVSNPKMIKVGPPGTHFQKRPLQSPRPQTAAVLAERPRLHALITDAAWRLTLQLHSAPFSCLSALAATDKGQLHRIANTSLSGKKTGDTHLQGDKCDRTCPRSEVCCFLIWRGRHGG